nr:MAG TPA: repressor protein [Caudoviricetes sp.]
MFYQRFSDAMRKTGVSMYQVSKETGIAQSTISRWKTQNSTPNLKTLKVLADYFNVPTSYFTEGVEGTPEIKNIERKIDLKKITDSTLICYYGDRELTEKQKKKLQKVLKAVLDD